MDPICVEIRQRYRIWIFAKLSPAWYQSGSQIFERIRSNCPISNLSLSLSLHCLSAKRYNSHWLHTCWVTTKAVSTKPYACFRWDAAKTSSHTVSMDLHFFCSATLSCDLLFSLLVSVKRGFQWKFLNPLLNSFTLFILPALYS